LPAEKLDQYRWDVKTADRTMCDSHLCRPNWGAFFLGYLKPFTCCLCILHMTVYNPYVSISSCVI